MVNLAKLLLDKWKILPGKGGKISVLVNWGCDFLNSVLKQGKQSAFCHKFFTVITHNPFLALDRTFGSQVAWKLRLDLQTS